MPSLGPARKPYDSLESIHSLLEISSTPTTLSDSLLETSEMSGEAPPAEPPPDDNTGTRPLGEVASPPMMPDLSPASDATASAAPAPPPSSKGLAPADDVPLLQHVLKQKARLGSTAAPVGVWAGAAALVFAVGAMCVAALFTALVTRSSAPPAASASATASAPEPPPPSEPAPEASAPPLPKSQLEKARAGDVQAIAEIEKKPAAERSVEESVALMMGNVAAERKELAEMGKALAGKEPDKEQIDRLQKASRDSALAADAIHVMATMAGPTGPDLLYEVWTGTPRRTSATELAEALLSNPKIREKASPALLVALDLRAAETCEDSAKVLPRAEENGDRRSLMLVGKMLRKNGCGDTKREDCYPCLRKGDAIKDALKAVRAKAAPRY